MSDGQRCPAGEQNAEYRTRPIAILLDDPITGVVRPGYLMGVDVLEHLADIIGSGFRGVTSCTHPTGHANQCVHNNDVILIPSELETHSADFEVFTT